jgi:hypothetical protein
MFESQPALKVMQRFEATPVSSRGDDQVIRVQLSFPSHNFD